MNRIYADVNKRIDPKLKEEYRKYTGFEPEDELVRHYIHLGARKRGLPIGQMLDMPMEELVSAVEKYIRQDVKGISTPY